MADHAPSLYQVAGKNPAAHFKQSDGRARSSDFRVNDRSVLPLDFEGELSCRWIEMLLMDLAMKHSRTKSDRRYIFLPDKGLGKFRDVFWSPSQSPIRDIPVIVRIVQLLRIAPFD